MLSTNALRVCISNLPKNTNEDRLCTIFSDIDFIKITIPKCFKGECKGYGYIDLSCEKDVKKVLEMNGYVLDGKKIKLEMEKEEMNELKKQNSTRDSTANLAEQSGRDSVNLDPNKQVNYKEEMVKISDKFNEQIFKQEADDSENLDIHISLSTDNPQLVSEMIHLFPNMSEKEFNHQIHKNDELKKIYKNCCTSIHSTEEKLQKIKHLKFDDNPMRDEQLKTLCSVLVKSFENNKDIDFNICNRLVSNLKTINCFPDRAVVFELLFSYDVLGEHNFKEFAMDKRKQKIMEMTFQKKIGELLDVPFGEVVFLKVREGTVKFCGIIPSKKLLEKKDNEMDTDEYVYKVLKPKLKEGLSKIYPLKSLEMALQTFKCKMSLNPTDFDTAGDYYFRTKKGDKQTRGGMPYFQPSKQWKRFGLRVTGVYENDEWLKMDGNPNEWAVAFHGTQNDDLKVECGSSDSKCKENSPKAGIRFAQNVEECYNEPVEWEGEKYLVAFQCRIHPEHVWVTGDRSFVAVESSNYVRPYGIVMKKISNK